MNKKLLVVAVAAAVAAPVTAIADVTIYGKLHMSLDYVMSDNQAASGQDKNNLNVSSNSSRIGFKGSEDLGGGLKGIWQVEQSVNLDESGSQWATRNSFLGVSSGFGDLLLGRHDTPYKVIGRALRALGARADRAGGDLRPDGRGQAVGGEPRQGTRHRVVAL